MTIVPRSVVAAVVALTRQQPRRKRKVPSVFILIVNRSAYDHQLLSIFYDDRYDVKVWEEVLRYLGRCSEV